jgi:hypothetical protein
VRDRYPGYDVLGKRYTPSWNDKTRDAVDSRLAIEDRPRFLTSEAWETLSALADRVVPQPEGRAPIPVAGMIDAMLAEDYCEGFRHARMPKLREAWARALAAIDAEAVRMGAERFAHLAADRQDQLLAAMKDGALRDPAWGDMPPKLFFSLRLLPDLTGAYYAHPSAWSAIGFGGPASPRGYVRLEPGIRDPWEATEADADHEIEARGENRRIR